MTSPPSKEDQRKYPRLSKQVDVKAKKLAYPFPKGHEKKGTLKNIGENGVCFNTGEPFKTDDILSLEIKLTGWQHHKNTVANVLDDNHMSAPLTAVVQVMWSIANPDGNGFEVGVKFLDLYEDDLKALKKHLEKIL